MGNTSETALWMSLWFILVGLTLPLCCMKLKWGSVDFAWNSLLCSVQVYSTDIARAVLQILAEAVTLRCPGKEHGMLILIRHTDKLRKIQCREMLFKFIDEREFPIAQHLANELRDKISYKGSLSSVCKFLKSSALNALKPVMDAQCYCSIGWSRSLGFQNTCFLL